MNSTITTTQPHGIEPGQTISIQQLDKRLWRRIWYFITFRSRPTITRYYVVTSVADETSLEPSPTCDGDCGLCDECTAYAARHLNWPDEEECCNCGECDSCVAARSDEHYDRKRDGLMMRED